MTTVFLYNTCPLVAARAEALLAGIAAPTVVSSWEDHGWDEDYAIFIDAMIRLGVVNLTDETVDTSILTGPVLIAKTSICSSTAPADIANIVNAFEPMVEYDIFYLSKWLDRCDQYEYISSPLPALRLVQTYNPHGFHAIVFQPTGIERVLERYHPADHPLKNCPFGQALNNMIARDSKKYEPLIALTTTPTLLSFDVVECRQCETDSMKLSECRDVPTPAQPGTSRLSANLVFFWFLLIAVVILITAWIFVKMGMSFSHRCPANICPDLV